MKMLKIDFNSIGDYLLVALLAFIAPIQALLLGVGVLIVFDTISGVYKAYKLKQPIVSKKLGNVVSKFLLYIIAIISGYILQKMFGVDWIPFAKIIAVAISLTELKSILENVNSITGIDIWQFVRSYLKRNTDQISTSVNEVLDTPKKEA